jgi:hypothetical protein
MAELPVIAAMPGLKDMEKLNANRQKTEQSLSFGFVRSDTTEGIANIPATQPVTTDVSCQMVNVERFRQQQHFHRPRRQ